MLSKIAGETFNNAVISVGLKVHVKVFKKKKKKNAEVARNDHRPLFIFRDKQ